MLIDARKTVIAVACALALGACSDSTEPDEEQLTMEEATALFLGLRAAANPADETIQPIFFSPDSIIVPCPLRGTAKLVGPIPQPVEPVEGVTTLETNYEVTPRGCGVLGGGFHFTVDGNPSVRDILSMSINIATFEIRVEGSTRGTLDWDLGGRTGTCEMDLTLSGEPDLSGGQPSFSASYTGTLCGHDVEIDASSLIVPAG